MGSSSSFEVLILNGTKDGVAFPEGLASVNDEGTVCERGMREGRCDECGVARVDFGVVLGEGNA